MKSRALQLYEKVRMLEASMSRIYTHTYGDSMFVILTADKGSWFYFPDNTNTSIFGDVVPPEKQKEYTKILNNKRRKELIKDLRGLGYGYFPIEGHYVEAGSHGESGDPEKSFFVLKNKDTDPRQFRREMMELGSRYDQDCILWKNSEGCFVWLYTRNFEDEDGVRRKKGDTKFLGKDFVAKVEKDIDGVIRGAYSRLKNKPDTQEKTFVFGDKDAIENERQERNRELARQK